MSKAIDALRKRRFYKFTIGGDDIFLRALKYSEIDRAQALGDSTLGDGFILGLCVLNEDGSQAFTQRPAEGEHTAESDNDFAKRVISEVDIYTDIAAEISNKVMSLSRARELEHLVKN